MADYENEAYGYIYLTTNLVNGRKYIGKHKSPTFDPNYKGSGKVLRQAFVKYGWDNFSVVLIKWCYSLEDLNLSEKEIIDKYNAVKSSEYYNLKQGGDGGWDCSPFWRGEMVGSRNPNYGRRYRLNLTQEQREKRRQRLIGNSYGKNASKETLERISKQFTGEGNPFYGKHHSEETKKIISESRKGEKNPCYHKIWITNGEICKRISEDEYESYVQLGYYRGRIVSEKTRRNMSKSQSKRQRDSKGRWT